MLPLEYVGHKESPMYPVFIVYFVHKEFPIHVAIEMYFEVKESYVCCHWSVL